MKSRILAFVAAVVVATAGYGWAQETTGSIAGRVSDPQGLAVPGATVTVTGPQGSQTFTADAEGRFNAPFLTPGTYTVRAELQGFKVVEQRNVVVRLGQRVELPVTMEVGGLTETVEVTGGSPTIDTSTTTVGAVDQCRPAAARAHRPPLQRRALHRARRDEQRRGRREPVHRGRQRSREPVRRGRREHHEHRLRRARLVLDLPRLARQRRHLRLRQRDPGEDRGLRGRVRPVHGRRGERAHEERHEQPARQPVRLRAAHERSKAEFEQVQTENGAINTAGTQTSDAGFTVGGPICRDRIFFFGAYNPSWETRTITAPAGFPLESLGEVDRKRHINSYSAKASGAARQRSPARCVVLRRPGEGRHGTAAPVVARRGPTRPAFSSLEYGGHNQTVKYDGVLRPSWLVEATVSRAQEQPGGDPVGQRVPDRATRTVVPNIDQRRHRVLRGGQRGHQPAVPGQVHAHLRRAPDPLWRALRGHRVQQHQPVHGPDLHAVRRAA